MNDFMTDTDIGMDGNWMTYQEDDLTNNEKAEMAADWNTPEKDRDKGYMKFTDEEWEDMTKDWESVEDENGISGTQEEQENFRQEERERLGRRLMKQMDFGREEYQENGPDAYADMPHIHKLTWELPE